MRRALFSGDKNRANTLVLGTVGSLMRRIG